MSGHIVVDGTDDVSPYDRFALEFADGTRMALRDKRRLSRAVVNPDFSHVGPDAADVGRDDFRRLIGAGRTAVKARLLNQHAIAGVGNLLADQILWQARIAPGRSTADLDNADLDRLRRELRAAVRSAIRKGGAHTGAFIPERRADGVCPRCGHHPLSRGRIGGRTTYWCPVCQT
jgi:formamidopyrimidine-DNA glycosylase